MSPLVKKTLIGLGAAVAVALIFALVATVTVESQNNPRIRSADVDVSGSLARFTAPGAADPEVGKTAPSFTGVNFAGDPVAVVPGDGVPTMVFFLTHWCAACQAELPQISDWYPDADGVDRDSSGDGVRVVLVSTSVDASRGNYPPASWFAAEGWEGEIVVDSASSEAFNAYGATGYPYLVAFDGDGEIVFRYVGQSSPSDWDDLVGVLNSDIDLG